MQQERNVARGRADLAGLAGGTAAGGTEWSCRSKHLPERVDRRADEGRDVPMNSHHDEGVGSSDPNEPSHPARFERMSRLAVFGSVGARVLHCRLSISPGCAPGEDLADDHPSVRAESHQ